MNKLLSNIFVYTGIFSIWGLVCFLTIIWINFFAGVLSLDFRVPHSLIIYFIWIAVAFLTADKYAWSDLKDCLRSMSDKFN
jgi:hypothetical protein